ncbi:MAG: cadherin-like beta sandwich domain-containing protein [Lachnospiraceae bacterium]
MKKKIAILLAFVLVLGLFVGIAAKKTYARAARMYMEIPENVKKEQEITVKVLLDSDVNLYSIDAYVSYDPTLLTFVPENDIITGDNGIVEIKDVFGEETKQKEYYLTFRTIDVGAAYINLTDVYLIDFEDLDYISVPSAEYSMEIGINENVAEDARLSDLIVAPGDLTQAFSPNQLNYEMYVGMDVQTISISAFAIDEDSVIEVDMPDTLVEGENLIKIVVTALSGNVNTYTICVIKGDLPEEVTTEDAGEENIITIEEVTTGTSETEETQTSAEEVQGDAEETEENTTEEVSETTESYSDTDVIEETE